MKTALKLPLVSMAIVFFALCLVVFLPQAAHAIPQALGPYIVEDPTGNVRYVTADGGGWLEILGDSAVIVGMTDDSEDYAKDIRASGHLVGIEINDTYRSPIVIDNLDAAHLASASEAAVVLGNAQSVRISGPIQLEVSGTVGALDYYGAASSTITVMPGAKVHAVSPSNLSASSSALIDLSQLSATNPATVGEIKNGSMQSLSFAVPIGTVSILDLLEAGATLDITVCPVFIDGLQVGTVDSSGKITYTRTYPVTFCDWDGTLLETQPQAVGYGLTATAPTAPTRDGYTFAGWQSDIGTSIDDPVTAATTFTATYTIDNPSGAFVGGAAYTKGSNASLIYKVEKDYALFEYAEVDGERVGDSQVEVKDGSTTATLKASYLDTLSTGSHTVKVVFSDGTFSEGSFQVIDAVTSADAPDPHKLAAASDTTPYAGVALLGALALGCLAVARRKLDS